ncbi:protein arginine kinase [Thermovenabulum gondwanense]|uniref:Protein-arginine kinase n=1 Tax=Thermovenabulum gondwanense TaxID=520767 RepID=A0A161PW72_9FIRM|nr:protein arginine kinase [Thermovenabulum gondwanense]KYO67381.1 Protein-arginine kinase [Thermovenabulum gondwanense]
MSLEEILDTSKISWLNNLGPESDIVISSRVRLARNLKDVPFPHLLSDKKDTEIIELVYNAFKANEILSKESKIYLMKELTPNDRQLFVEMHLISPDLASSEKGAVIVSGDKTFSIMINEEDHIRIQVIFPGLSAEDAYELAGKIDDVLEESLEFAFDEKLGYLTACPTNVGTGIRASVMLHLPVLTLLKQTDRMFSAMAQLGLVVRGIYGEGTEAKGNLYQISNQITLGKTEEDIIEGLNSVVKQIISSERQARRNLKNEDRIRLEDRILRSYGILTNARLLSSEEAMAHLSNVRLGIDLGIIKNLKPEEVNKLFMISGPAYIQKLNGKSLQPVERDIIRANFIRGKLIKEG